MHLVVPHADARGRIPIGFLAQDPPGRYRHTSRTARSNTTQPSAGNLGFDAQRCFPSPRLAYPVTASSLNYRVRNAFR